MDMTLDVTQVLTGLDGEALMDLKPIYDDKGMSGEDKVKIWCLAGKIQKEDVVELVAEDVALLKKRVGAAYGPAIVGPAFMLLNGTAGKKQDKAK